MPVDMRTKTFRDENDGEDGLHLEVRRSFDSFEDEPQRFEIICYKRNSGMGMGVSIGSFERACEIAERWFEELLPEYREQQRLSEIRWEKQKVRMERESSEHKEREKQERAERRAKAKQATVKVERAICPECDHADERSAFDIEVRECSRCGQTYVGEDARRCPECNIFTARVGDLACPACEQPLEAEPELVTGVEVDGVFVPDAELADHA